MPKSIACIPHNERLTAHRIEYLKAINKAMDYPFQSEDGRDPSPIHQKLEEQCIKYTGINNWLFTNCCTDSLQIAFQTLCDIGDTIIVPAYGWRAIANAPKFVGCNIQFCDIDETGNVNLELLFEMILKYKPRAILIVHGFGNIVDVSKISGICKDKGVAIIEDAAPSFTMNEPYKYKLGLYSDIVCFSFDFTKSPASLGAGGAIATNNSKIYQRLKKVCSHRTVNNIVGTKSYLDTVAAAVVSKDMQLIEQHSYRKKKVEIATFYLNNLPYKTLLGENYIFHRFIILPEKDEKQNLINKLKSQKILAKGVYESNCLNSPRALEFYERAIELPCHAFMDIDDLKSRIKKIV